jgi:glycosyltransferase involved in cell wall biosynthesis
MRIVFVISALIYGGAETQVIALSRELVLRGHAVTIYTLNSDNPRANELHGSGVSIISDQKETKLDIDLIFRLRRYVKQYRADIVQGFLFEGDFYARVAAARTGIPTFSSERNDNYVLNSNQRIALKVTRKLASGVIANTYAGSGFAQKLHRFPSDRVHVVWNGVDLEVIEKKLGSSVTDYRQEFFGSDPVKIACLTGNIKPQKDYLLALRVAEQLMRDQSTWRVLFVGERVSEADAYFDQVMANCRELGLEGRVRFSGLRKDVPEIMSQCDVIFSTSLHEGFPNVVLEAMAVGTPVASTKYSDIQRILPNAWQVVESREPSDIVAAIVRADCERDEISRQQREWLEANATIATSAARLVGIYRQYVNQADASKVLKSSS